MNNLCINTGKSYNTAIILTAIPVTGVLELDKWLWVAGIWLVLFGDLFCAILISCFIPCVCKCLKAWMILLKNVYVCQQYLLDY